MRQVILICGPPGSGKTTLAYSLGLPVYDRDDPQWRGEAHFAATIAQLKHDPNAQAVVIRSGAKSTSRKRTAGAIGATEVRVLDVDADTCIRRVIARNRPRPSIERQIAGVREWWRKHETDKGYDPRTARRQREARYDRDFREQRKQAAKLVAAGQAICAEAVCLKPTRWIEPGTPWDLCHDTTGQVVLGPGHRACNRSEAARRGNRQRSQAGTSEPRRMAL